MGKTKIKRNNTVEAPEFRAIHKYAKMSPQKCRLVMDMIRGLPVSEALDQLRFSPKRAAFLIDKVLKSAIANADQAIDGENIRDTKRQLLEPQPEELDVDDLYVHEARADDGPRHKRWRPRARGSAFPYRKYFCHLTIQLRPMPEGK